MLAVYSCRNMFIFRYYTKKYNILICNYHGFLPKKKLVMIIINYTNSSLIFDIKLFEIEISQSSGMKNFLRT